MKAVPVPETAAAAPKVAAASKIPKAGPPAQAAPIEAKSTTGPVSGAIGEAPPLSDFVTMWPAVMEATKTYSRVAWMLFNASQPLSVANGTLAVGVPNAGQVNNARTSGHDERLRQAILDVMRADVRIDVVLAPNAIAPNGNGGAASMAVAAEVDAPSLDDDDQDDESGVDLAIRALGATQIGEIEH